MSKPEYSPSSLDCQKWGLIFNYLTQSLGIKVGLTILITWLAFVNEDQYWETENLSLVIPVAAELTDDFDKNGSLPATNTVTTTSPDLPIEKILSSHEGVIDSDQVHERGSFNSMFYGIDLAKPLNFVIPPSINPHADQDIAINIDTPFSLKVNSWIKFRDEIIRFNEYLRNNEYAITASGLYGDHYYLIHSGIVADPNIESGYRIYPGEYLRHMGDEIVGTQLKLGQIDSNQALNTELILTAVDVIDLNSEAFWESFQQIDSGPLFINPELLGINIKYFGENYIKIVTCDLNGDITIIIYGVNQTKADQSS